MSENNNNKSIILPIFNGKHEAFQVRWTKFRAFATAKGIVQALLGKEDALPDSEEEELDPNADADKIKAKERNRLAMAYLLADVSLACETMTDEWPGGLACEVVEKLMKVYKPKDNITEVEVYKCLQQVKMKKNEDLKVLFEQVAAIQNWYNDGNKKLPKEQLIGVVIAAALPEYLSGLSSEQMKHGASHLRAIMNVYYHAPYKTNNNNDKDNDEMALTNQDGGNGMTATKSRTKRKRLILKENVADVASMATWLGIVGQIR